VWIQVNPIQVSGILLDSSAFRNSSVFLMCLSTAALWTSNWVTTAKWTKLLEIRAPVEAQEQACDASKFCHSFGEQGSLTLKVRLLCCFPAQQNLAGSLECGSPVGRGSKPHRQGWFSMGLLCISKMGISITIFGSCWAAFWNGSYHVGSD
jgi:hypothetical protein